MKKPQKPRTPPGYAPLIVETLVKIYAEDWKLKSSEINCGMCFNFASDLKKALGEGATVIWNYDFDHAYVRFGGLLYDAETPYGVRRYTQLPAISRQRC